MYKNANIRSDVLDVNQEIIEARRHIHQFMRKIPGTELPKGPQTLRII